MSTRQFEPAEPELMDRPDTDPAELQAALRSLRGLNRYFGSHRLITKFLRRWIKHGDQLRVADLATGSADIPRLVADHARRVGAKVQIVAVDYQPSTVEMARELSGGYPEIACTHADVLGFGAGGEYDLVICSLALHHFSNEDAVRLLRRCREISRRFVLVSDLRRGLLATAGVYLLTGFIFRDRITREDARVSPRRAFTFRELHELATQAGGKTSEQLHSALRDRRSGSSRRTRRMEIIENVAAVESFVAKSGKRRVLVPTMGALHKGHLELIGLARAAGGSNGEVAVSIFVNPLQFEPGADFSRYPRPQAVDEDLCRGAGVDLLFRPAPHEMYSDDRSITVDEQALSNTLCGKSRPGHFRGVCTVVTKLFHLLAPAAAVFGEKDFQQLAIIRRMVRDLNFAIEIIGAPTVREPDGLACSSRNQYLNPEEREQATILRGALLKAVEAARNGETSANAVLAGVRDTIARAPLGRIDYVELVDADNLQPQEDITARSLVAVAVFFGQTRLIDNIRLA